MSCEEHFADALLGSGEDGCPDCQHLVSQSQRLATQFSRLPRHTPPASVWENLSSSLRATRQRQRASFWSRMMTGLAAAALLLCLIHPMISPAPESPAAQQRSSASQPRTSLVPELAVLQQEPEDLMALAGPEY